MCIMEVRAGQHASTIAQALAHNLQTSVGDLAMFRQLLIARGDVEALGRVERASVAMQTAYEALLNAYGAEVAHDVDSGHNPDSGHIGMERRPAHIRASDHDMVVDAARIAAGRARRYETR